MAEYCGTTYINPNLETNELKETINRLKKENENLKKELIKKEKYIQDFQHIVDNSEGVSGWHMNGDVATWSELNL